MKANKEMDDLHRKVVKKWHTLARLCGMTQDEKMAVLQSYGVESSSDMQTHDLIDVCASLQKRIDDRTGASTKTSEMDKLRKRCLRCLCDYIKIKKIKTADIIKYAKQIACRAAKKEEFNRLTAAELRGIIGYFNKERNTYESTETITKSNDNTLNYYLLNIKPIGEA